MGCGADFTPGFCGVFLLDFTTQIFFFCLFFVLFCFFFCCVCFCFVCFFDERMDYKIAVVGAGGVGL